MVLSVIAMSAAFAGAAAANHGDEDVTFTDQALGMNDGDTAFVVESVTAHEGQYLEIEHESGEVVFETELDGDLTNAAVYVPSEKPGQYTATVYADDSKSDTKASATATVYGAGIEMSDQSADDPIDQVNVDVAALLDGHGDDTEFDVVLTDADDNELGTATGLTGVNNDVSIDTSTIETETVVTATVYLDGEPIQAYYDEADGFVTIADSATVTPGMDDGDETDETDEKDDDKKDDETDETDDDKKDEKDYEKKGDKDYDDKKDDKKDGKDYEKKADKDYDDKKDDDKEDDKDDANGDNGAEDDDGVSNDGDGDQDTDSETDQSQESEQDAEQDASNEQEQDSEQENVASDNEDEDGLPGFGVGVALVAMLAAAMLALRRQN
ncbi:hypothetical protein C495_16013 [Natronorubrum sulfidifaciens JCM 14089]|uniref:PGF-CTERM archaeal protein-sorting signal domain-containing protein n=2 Tax=Natronorubrum sulfidifaciens TaxID=388259 RepID=L9VYK5_9EURY|nr:hypothetical protein C495_16013 [Natronorubrum sulfidifaciens JCM 14089]